LQRAARSGCALLSRPVLSAAKAAQPAIILTLMQQMGQFF